MRFKSGVTLYINPEPFPRFDLMWFELILKTECLKSNLQNLGDPLPFPRSELTCFNILKVFQNFSKIHFPGLNWSVLCPYQKQKVLSHYFNWQNLRYPFLFPRSESTCFNISINDNCSRNNNSKSWTNTQKGWLFVLSLSLRRCFKISTEIKWFEMKILRQILVR